MKKDMKNNTRHSCIKGQVAFETILIVGFIFLLLIPLLFILFNRAISIQDELATIETSRALFTISSAVDSVGVLGPNNSVIIEVSFPNNVKNISLGNDNQRELSAILQTSLGEIHIVKLTQFGVSPTQLDSIKSGRYLFRITYPESGGNIEISLD